MYIDFRVVVSLHFLPPFFPSSFLLLNLSLPPFFLLPLTLHSAISSETLGLCCYMPLLAQLYHVVLLGRS